MWMSAGLRLPIVVLLAAVTNYTALAASNPPAAAPRGPLFERALKVPPQDLAASYLTVDGMALWTDFACKGGNIHTMFDGRPVVIDASNAERYARAYSERRAAYAAAIEKRGFPKIAGTYSARTNSACSEVRAGAILPGVGQEGLPSEITVTQDGFKIALAQGLGSDIQGATLSHPGTVVESSIVVTDAMASDFIYVGSVKQDEIELRPWVEQIQASQSNYPAPFKPNRQALSRCVISLKLR